MTKTEARAFNTLLNYLLTHGSYAQQAAALRPEKARFAAEYLADRAHQSLGAGWLARDVGPAWERAQPPRCEELAQARADE